MIKAAILDLDGTVYEGSRLIDGADTAIDEMRVMGIKVVFCTNNSSRPAGDIAEKLNSLGIPCDVRDWVEKAFDVYKNGLEGDRDNTGNPERARGRLFIKFIALMMRIRIQNVLRDHDRDVLRTKAKKDSVNGMSVSELLLSLNTVFAIGNTGDWRLTHISKNIREIFTVFGLEQMESGQIVLG